ncbi:MAG: GGDEF domain-containing protein [Betaproteobacteria bacterium]|jgi:diguanylate cyclase (GGDEF)-like protein|nr:GGDEF domain-containing protein [Betaproteobacteria bacterium]
MSEFERHDPASRGAPPVSSLFRSRPRSFLVALVAAIGVAAVDALTGDSPSFTAFYALPVVLAAWGAGLAGGIAMALIAGAAALGMGFLLGHPYPATFPFVFDTVSVTGLLVVTGVLTAGLRAASDRARATTRTDVVTSIMNRLGFSERLSIELDRHQRYRRPFTLVLVHCDGLADLAALDAERPVRLIGRTLGASVRRTDAVGRIEEDVFAIVLPETARDNALLVAQMLRDKLDIDMRREGRPMSFGLGLVTYMEPPDTAELALETAEKVLGEARQAGKNRVRELVVGNA